MRTTQPIRAGRAAGIALFAAAGFAGGTPGQDATDLARVVLIEEQEHDLARAEKGYRELTWSEAPAAVRADAWLRLGALLRRMGREAEARAAFAACVALETDAAAAARTALEQDPQDPERQKALRARAKQLIDEWWADGTEVQGGEVIGLTNTVRNAWPPLRQNLAWIGPVAVPEMLSLIERLRSLEARARFNQGLGWETITKVTDLVVELGGDAAVGFLQRAAESDDENFRRAVAQGLHTEMGDPRLFEIAARMTTDPDLEVAVAALGWRHGSVQRQWVWARYPVSVVLQATQHPARSVRSHAYGIISGGWVRLRHDPDPAATVARLVPILEREFASVDPERALDAVACLNPGLYSGVEGRRLMVERWRDHRSHQVEVGFRVTDGTDVLPDLIAALPERADGVEWRSAAEQQHLRPLVTSLLRRGEGWDRRAVPLLIELGVKARVPEALRLALDLAEPEDASHFVRVLPETTDLGDEARRIVDWLSVASRSGSAPPETWPALRACLDQGLAPYNSFAEVAGWSAHPDAVQWLVTQVESKDGLTEAAARGLRVALVVRDDPDTRAGVRQIIASRVEDSVAAAAMELIRVGDPQVLTQLTTGAFSREELTAVQGLFRPMATSPDSHSIASLLVSPECGFAPADRIRALRAILEQEGSCWSAIGKWMAPQSVTSNALWPVPIEREPDPGAAGTLLALAREQNVSGPARRALAWWALEQGDDWFEDFLSGNDSFAEVALHLLEQRVHNGEPSEALQPYAPRLLEMLEADFGDRHGDVARTVVSLCLDEEHGLTGEQRQRAIDVGLGHPAGDVRRQVLFEAHESLTPAQFAQCILDEECRSLVHSLIPVDAGEGTPKIVAALLAAIAETQNQEREQLMAALDRIRAYQEQKAHWDRVFQGVDASSNAAAEKLLMQAKPDQKKDVRLLAIRSLGALGVPETLPFLIEWSQGDDAEIAKASLAAIDRIHRAAK